MRFLIDAQLPPALARWLVEQGHAADHVADIGMAAASDWDIWQRATASAAIIVTKDEDVARRRAMADAGPTIVWVRVGNTTRRVLLEWFRLRLPSILDALRRGERLVEVL